mmetsp:Transcript_132275/g.197059  ORF Transcript_132275/g.197059 Transcript_132275/m.197059 type:complete len:195 (-) Transcript_132275:68-652(-)|eukprot:CAMPEP_0117039138 /NCGR_PEP_ID=MMETSP0472-20121206/27498_1 /TAXON_ID=693140 ORGANISM="Tiarina fusus, Strain LIS" /NCGR_SAMPLE_ID=MMETSP0472 /ASSEMBLY_ACC=CAM_ASM_000603 /LENGTH=194 /DNA_ID=CAMNT_0004749567 /DNA_START=116 /DNA_END=700 /DNA_ORIENTATION=+
MMELGTTNAKLEQAQGQPKSSQPSLHARYPIKSTWEFILHNGETVKGEVYCTDPLADIVVLHDQLGEVRMVSVSAIKESNQLQEAATEPIPSSNVTHVKKILEEREKRAIRLAQESLRHLNPKASPKGQAVFDRLLKACNEVVWKGESIIVMNQIQVDPPYSQETCKLLPASASQAGGSLDRVQKIVVAASSVS